MDRFLDALTPALREQVEAAIEDPEARSRLEWTASRYIDDEGNWPTDQMTAQTIAQQFLHRQGDYEGQRFGSSGLGSTTVAALAGGAVAIGAGSGLTVLSSKVMSSYWTETLAYSTGLHPYFIRAMKGVVDRVSEGTPWARIGQELVGGPGPVAGASDALDTLMNGGLAGLMEREMYGVFRRAAWRGTRSALFHTTGHSIGDPSQENAWVEQYVRNFAQNQEGMARRTIVSVVNDALEHGHGSRAIAERLKMNWKLTPRHAIAVENYRRGLIQQERTARESRTLAQRYASRLHASRLRTLSQTEMHTAFNLGREAQWIQAIQDGTLPLGTKKMWVTAKDEAVCPVCRPLDGVVTDLGATFEGEISIYVPGAHPNCRCIITPVEDRRTPDFSRDTKLVFPPATVSKHLGGPSGEEPHPSGSQQQVHAGGVAAGAAAGAAAGFLSANIAGSNVTAGEGLLGAMLGGGVFALTRNPMAIHHLRTLRHGGSLPHASPGSFTDFGSALRADRAYRSSIKGWASMDALGSALRRVGYTFENTRPDHVGRVRHMARTAGTRTAAFADTDRNLVARVGSHYHGSTATNPTILGIQEAAQKVFGLADATTAHFAQHTRQSAAAARNAFGGVGYEPYVKAQYAATQAHLRKRGIKEVTVARGMKMSRADAQAMGLDIVTEVPRGGQSIWQNVNVPTQPLNSVTTSPVIAGRYATGITGMAGADDVAVIMRRVVKSDEVFANYKTGLGMRRWQEWIVKGGNQEWQVVAVDPRLIASRTRLEQRMAITPGARPQITLQQIWDS